MPLSEIAEDITVIEPGLTDESLISYVGAGIRLMISTESNIIVAMGGLGSQNTAFVFNKDGKFVRYYWFQGTRAGIT